MSESSGELLAMVLSNIPSMCNATGMSVDEMVDVVVKHKLDGRSTLDYILETGPNPTVINEYHCSFYSHLKRLLLCEAKLELNATVPYKSDEWWQYKYIANRWLAGENADVSDNCVSLARFVCALNDSKVLSLSTSFDVLMYVLRDIAAMCEVVVPLETKPEMPFCFNTLLYKKSVRESVDVMATRLRLYNLPDSGDLSQYMWTFFDNVMALEYLMDECRHLDTELLDEVSTISEINPSR